MGVYKDMCGLVFGQITVVADSGQRGKNGDVLWECKCSCGSVVLRRAASLNPSMKSCGCLNRVVKPPKTGRVPKYNTPTNGEFLLFHRSWSSMLQRCRSSHTDYGGRGITFTQEWEDYDAFARDMWASYVPGYTIDRIDPNGNYCRENCQWIPLAEQARNRTRRTDNVSGVTGVAFRERDNGWRAKVKELDGTDTAKFFSLAVYGDSAFRLACEWREENIKRLNNEGANYGPLHGKEKKCNT